MLSDVNSSLDEVVEVLGGSGSHASFFQDSEYFTSGHTFDLGDSVTISESDTNLRWRGTLFGELDDLIAEIIGGDLDPAGR
jgi:hypothetical protein